MALDFTWTPDYLNVLNPARNSGVPDDVHEFRMQVHSLSSDRAGADFFERTSTGEAAGPGSRLTSWVGGATLHGSAARTSP